MATAYLCCAWRGEHDDTGPVVLLTTREAVARFLAGQHTGDCADTLARFERWDSAEPFFFWRDGAAGGRVDRHVWQTACVAQEV